jgi:hypothetical protein
MYGLKPVPFTLKPVFFIPFEIRSNPHLKVEMWGTHICFASDQLQKAFGAGELFG